MLLSTPEKEEVYETLKEANLGAAPGTDGKFNGEKLPNSMRTAMMVFGTKPKKANSLNPRYKRRISLLNYDCKLGEGLDARTFWKITTRCLSPVQYVGASDRRIHHGLTKARDAIIAAGRSKVGFGIADTDVVAAFDWLALSWVWQVLENLGVDRAVINSVIALYEDSITITVVNYKFGRVFLDRRGSLRQEGCVSTEWFCFGIDPLVRYLENRLQGIPISSLPVLGPACHGEMSPLPPKEERFQLMAYCDNIKPSITSCLLSL